MEDETRPFAKAAGFNSVVAVLRDTMLGKDVFAGVVARLPPDTAEAIRTPPLPVQWIPCERYGDLVSAALKYGFRGDEDQLVEMGRRAFLHDLKTLYRVFIKFMSPGYVIRRASSLWLTYNKNNGLLTAEQLDEHRCAIKYDKIVAVYPGFWSYQRGCLLAAVQATGYVKATVVVSRPGSADGNATFTVDWSSR